ncbi:hypothetical protein [Fluviicola chungangensis]|uniref:DUF3078 domain-containing protein n=1 Tax=Fluviicola chungangensis TaxID=2597671 RepID=A0A556MJD6_9FLAO|nr:hypothetical protein [Fluviicola chungangensis]TSJ39935.1 hypothetical protein FO442_16645 [Fluviicola chungangensis]
MRILIFLLITGLASGTFAQDDTQEKLQRLTAPTSPASAITGMQPTTVLAPKTLNALETALYNNFTDAGSIVIPKDLAIEFTPYWSRNPHISLSEYLYPTAWQSFLRNASFSVSSSQSFLLGDSTKSNALGFGARTSIYFGGKNDRDTIENYRKQLRSADILENKFALIRMQTLDNPAVQSITDFMQSINQPLKKLIGNLSFFDSAAEINQFMEAFCADTLELPKLTASNHDEFSNAIAGLFRKHILSDQVYAHFKKYLVNRQGFSLDLALASLLNFPTNNFEFSYAPKNALWITPTYRFFATENHVLKLLAVYRYEWYNIDYYKLYFPGSTVYQNNHDYGISLAAEFKKCSVQAELVGRSSSTETPLGTDAEGNKIYTKKRSNDVQYLMVVNYRLTDQAILTFNFGNQFNPVINPKRTLVSTLSVNFGFGSPKKSSVNLAK